MKHLRKLLSALLVLTMLLSALPMTAFAEEGKAPAVVTEAIDAHTHEQTEEPAVEPTIELIETPAVEEAEAPSAEPTEAPAVEEADEPTEEPAVEEVEEPVAEPAEALEDATAVEPEAEPEQEPVPAVEENKDESETEEASEPTENEEDDPLSGLTDEQLAALKDLPEGFSAEVVAYAMLRSTGCQHIDLDVLDNKEYDYKKINKEKHFVTIVYTSRRLRCNDCGETLQTISYEKTVSGEYGHDWYWCGWDESESSRRKSNYSFRCDNCDERITLDPPCNHESLVSTESGIICSVCHLRFWPGYDNDAPAPKCEHANYAVIYPGEEETVYLEWDYETHLKKKSVTFYFDDDNSWGYDAKCNDCGKWLIYENGKIDDTDYTGRSGVQYRTTSSEFEAHSFVNGVCEFCGEEKVEETCQHTNTKRVENTSKRTTERKPFDDAQHEVIVTKYYELYCADCNAYIRDDSTEETTSKEAHDFSNGDTCECGYAKEECEHDEKEKLEIATNVAYERIDGDQESHKIVRTRCYGMFCKACGELVSSLDPVVTNGKQKHTWKSTVYNNGVEKCSYCGAAKYENPTKGGYYAALKNLKEGENPLEEGSIVRSIILSELQKSGYSRKYAEEIITRAASAPETYRDIFVYSFLEYDRNSSGNNIYDHYENMMYSKKDEPVETFFHESGHAADGQPFREGNRKRYYYSLNEEYLNVLWDSMREDLRNFIEHTAFKSPYKFDDSVSKQAIQHVIDGIISNETGETTGLGRWIIKTRPASDFTEKERTIYAKLIADINERFAKAPFNNAMMVQDVMRGLTQNSLHSDWGHETSYWEHSVQANLEAWAEWFSSKMCGVDEYVEYNQTYFPKATRVLDDIACDMVEHYRKMIRES